MSYKLRIQEQIKKAVSELFGEDNELPNASIERTKTREHGDVATNIAMILSKPQKRNPIDIAEDIKKNIRIDGGLISHIEIAKPGFINIVVGDYALAESLIEICTQSSNFGLSPPNSKEKVLKSGLGTISALGIMSGFASDTSAGHTNQTSHVNQAARPDAWKQIDGDTCSYLHDNVNTHANHANY